MAKKNPAKFVMMTKMAKDAKKKKKEKPESSTEHPNIEPSKPQPLSKLHEGAKAIPKKKKKPR